MQVWLNFLTKSKLEKYGMFIMARYHVHEGFFVLKLGEVMSLRPQILVYHKYK
jgi:hypothetical protein